jgi:D-methionine transport system ATP-binding protein
MVLESSASTAPDLIRLDRVSLTVGLRRNRSGKVLSPGTRLFEQLNWALKPGESCGLIGSSGSGKTSWLRLLNRLISPTSGIIFWQGQPYGEIPVVDLRREILLVAQTPKLFGMTVVDAITYPLRLRQIPEGECKIRVDEICDRFALPTAWLSQTELQLSPSAQQWVSLARAIAAQPRVLLLDEPIALLDDSHTQQLTEILKSYAQMSLVLASHDRTWIQTLTPNLITLDAKHSRDQPDGDADW